VHSSGHCKVLIKDFAQILSPSVQTQGFYALAMLLHQCLGLKRFVGFKCLILSPHSVGDSVPCCIVSKGDKILLTLVHWGARWPPHISMDFITKMLGWRADSDLGNRLPCCMHKDIGIAHSLFRAGVQVDPNDGATLNELTSAADSYMAKSVVQLYYGKHFNCMS